MESKDRVILWFARHGEVEQNKENVFRGNLDEDLDKTGIIESLKLKKWFENKPLSFAASSARKRTMHTLKNIIAERKLPYAHVAELNGWDNGFGGLPKSPENIKKLAVYIKNPDKVPPNGQALSEWRTVVRPVLVEAIIMGMMSKDPGLVVIHSSVGHEIGEIIEGDKEAGHIKPGGVGAVLMDKSGKLHVKAILKPDKEAATQNALGVADKRAGLSS